MKVKEESEKVGLKFNFQKTKITASGPITSWQIDEETVEMVTGVQTCASSDLICTSEVINISPGKLDSSLCFFQPSVSHDVLSIEVK